MAKSPEMEALLNKFTLATFGRSRNGSMCVACGSEKIQPKDFRTPLDYKEFTISRMCQKCIDGVFGPPEDEILYDDSLDETDRYLESQAEFGNLEDELDYWGNRKV